MYTTFLINFTYKGKVEDFLILIFKSLYISITTFFKNWGLKYNKIS